jgi:hypothetical protein
MKVHKFYIVGAALVLGMYACTVDKELEYSHDGDISFSANVGKMRSRVLNNQWEGDEQIGVSLGENTASFKAYSIATDGTMSTTEEPYQWEGTPVNITAWTPLTDQEINLTDQTTEQKLYDCDLLFCQTQAKSKEVHLQFNHQMTKMLYMLQGHGAYTDEEAKNARIYFLGYGAVTYTKGIINPIGDVNTPINPRRIDDANGEAIMVPCEMWDKPLIKVEIGGDTHYYTPRKSTIVDGKTEEERKTGVLTPGAQQKYYIWVDKKGLTVNMESSSIGWDNETIKDDEITDSKFKINLDEKVQSLQPTLTNIDNNFISNSTFSLSYTETGIGGLICEGICDMVRTTSGTTHTYTFSNIASDIQIRYIDEYVAVGDYYYSDGTWGSEETKQDCTTLGQVFKVGMDDTDAIENYNGLSKIRGYVVCTSSSIPDNTYAWIKTADGNYKSYLSQLEGLTEDDRQNRKIYLGYQLTKGIETALTHFTSNTPEETLETEFPLYYTFKSLNLESPANSSGWYIPSIAQLQDIKSSGIYNGSDLYWSSNVYTEISGEEVARIWAWEYNMSDGTEKAGWASDPRKLILILTF